MTQFFQVPELGRALNTEQFKAYRKGGIEALNELTIGKGEPKVSVKKATEKVAKKKAEEKVAGKTTKK